ncbi:TonB-dependent receptor [Algiphilus sp.]|uniref:TonB-dependent receptor n=1 Tax=Algiphilus sp. TaxID=1872431 RepID=UPI003C523DD4
MIKQIVIATSLAAPCALWAVTAAAQNPQQDGAEPGETAQSSGQQPESASSTPSEAPEARRGAAMDEIVVTARRREESSQNVPVAVTAISGDQLERANVTDVDGLSTQVPSLVIIPSSSGSKSIPTFAIRGQSQQEQSIIADPSVPVYFNEIAVMRPHGLNQTLFDLESVEVLKGPQGTLFGRNSTGGAVLIRPKQPTREFEGYVGTTIGSFNRFDTTGMVNVPLSSWAQLRVSGQTTSSDGYIEDVVLGDEIDTEDTEAGRVMLSLQPAEGLESTFMFSRYIQDDGGTGAIIKTINPGSVVFSDNPASGALGYTGDLSGEQMLADQRERGIYDAASGVDQFVRVDTWDLTNTTTYDITDSVSIKNIIGTRRVNSDTHEDTDGLPVPLLQIRRRAEFEQFSNEFHLTGSTDSLNWITGLYYFQEEGGSEDSSIAVKPANQPPGNEIPQPVPTEFPGWSLTSPFGENTSKSVFAQATQSLDGILQGLSLTLGARYTWDTRKARIRNRSGDPQDPDGTPSCRFSRDLDNDPNTPETPAAEVPIDQCDVAFEKDFSEPTWNASLDYQVTPDNLIYFANRRGYRTGGFGARASSEAALSETFDAETVTDYELGTKNTFNIGGMSTRINLAVFHSDYTDIQRLLQDPGFIPVQTVPVNAADATISGGELEFVLSPTDNLEFSGFWSYTDASYEEFIDPNSGEDRSDQPFARAPEHVYRLNARYYLPLDRALGDISFLVGYFHTDGYSTNDTFAPEQSIEGYELVNVRADWLDVMGSNFDLGLSVENALDEEYLLPFGDLYTSTSLGHVSRHPGQPLTVLMDIRYRFGAAGS